MPGRVVQPLPLGGPGSLRSARLSLRRCSCRERAANQGIATASAGSGPQIAPRHHCPATRYRGVPASASANVGWVEGKNIVIEWRFSERRGERLRRSGRRAGPSQGRPDRRDCRTRDLRRSNRRPRRFPSLASVLTDPVGPGFAASLVRPGGNVTGLASLFPELARNGSNSSEKPLPGVSRVAVLWNPTNPGNGLDYKATEGAARVLRLDVFNPLRCPAPKIFDAPSRPSRASARRHWCCPGESRSALPEPGQDRDLRAAESAAVHVSNKGVCRSWGPDVLWAQPTRYVPPRGHLRGQDLEGREARRSSCRAANQVRAGDPTSRPLRPSASRFRRPSFGARTR